MNRSVEAVDSLTYSPVLVLLIYSELPNPITVTGRLKSFQYVSLQLQFLFESFENILRIIEIISWSANNHIVPC